MKAIQFSIKPCIIVIILFLSTFVLINCSNYNTKKKFDLLENGILKPNGIEISYPLNGTIFPPEFPAPTFEWKPITNLPTEYNVFISDTMGAILISSKSDKNIWKPDSTLWEKLKKDRTINKYNFTIIAEKENTEFLPNNRIQFTISKDSVGADIFYRAVPLPFSYAVKNVHTIEWYLGSIDGKKPRKMLDNLPVCGNCHSFAKEQPLLAMDVDYGNDKGSYVISKTSDTCNLTPDNIITWSDFKKDDNEPTFGLLSQISPDGNYVLSTVKDLSIFLAVDDNLAYSQLFFPIQGIIGIYDRNNKSFNSLNGANNTTYVQSNPNWSPDGKTVVFARTEAYVNEKVKKAGTALLSINDLKEFSTKEKEFKYDLYSLEFNNGEGGNPIPLEGASNNGKSNYFPKFSPDGKWIVFCQANNYMLLQPDSRLYIMPSEGGTPRLMNCNMEEMNSWHSWSPNGRWLVFSSKNKGLYTQLYLTHIDDKGMDSPAILLENLRFDNRAANIPEFYPFDANQFNIIKDKFSKTAVYYNAMAYDKIAYKYHKRAFNDLNNALKIDSSYLETYFSRMMLNGLLLQSNSFSDISDKQKAYKIVLDSLSKNPKNENYLALQISLLSSLNNIDQAKIKAQHALNTHHDKYKILELLSTIYRKEAEFEKAIQCYEKMLKISNDEKFKINNSIINTYIKLNKSNKALQLVNQLLIEYPENENLLYTRAQILINIKNLKSAKKDIDLILTQDSLNIKYNQILAQYYQSSGNKSLYNSQIKKTLQLLLKEHEQNKEDMEIIFELASFYFSLNDFNNAETFYNAILNNFADNYEALKQKALIYLNRKQWHDAILIYDQLEKNYLPEEGFYNNKAIAFIQIGRYNKALEYFNKTLEINPGNKDALFNRNRLLKDTANKKLE